MILRQDHSHPKVTLNIQMTPYPCYYDGGAYLLMVTVMILVFMLDLVMVMVLVLVMEARRGRS